MLTFIKVIEVYTNDHVWRTILYRVDTPTVLLPYIDMKQRDYDFKMHYLLLIIVFFIRLLLVMNVSSRHLLYSIYFHFIKGVL